MVSPDCYSGLWLKKVRKADLKFFPVCCALLIQNINMVHYIFIPKFVQIRVVQISFSGTFLHGPPGYHVFPLSRQEYFLPCSLASSCHGLLPVLNATLSLPNVIFKNYFIEEFAERRLTWDFYHKPDEICCGWEG